MEGNVGAREQRLVVALEGLRRLATVEVDGPYPGVLLQQRRKVIPCSSRMAESRLPSRSQLPMESQRAMWWRSSMASFSS